MSDVQVDEYVVRRAEEHGWFVWDDACGLVVAAFGSGDELCDWLRGRIGKPVEENQYGLLPGSILLGDLTPEAPLTATEVEAQLRKENMELTNLLACVVLLRGPVTVPPWAIKRVPDMVLRIVSDDSKGRWYVGIEDRESGA